MDIDKEINTEQIPPLNHDYSLKGQQIFTIINVCVYVNTIQKAMDKEWSPHSNTITPLIACYPILV